MMHLSSLFRRLSSPVTAGFAKNLRAWQFGLLHVLCCSIHANAALIPDSRESSISGNAQQVGERSASSYDLYATFNESVSGSINSGGPNDPPWVEAYSVSQVSTVSENGFSFETAFSGYANSGPFYFSQVNTFFRLVFTVDTPSTLRLTGSLSRLPQGHDVGINRKLRCCASPAETLWRVGDPLPTSIALDPAYTYTLTFGDSANVNSFNPGPPFSATHSILGTVTANVAQGPPGDGDVPLPWWSLVLLAVGLIGPLARRRGTDLGSCCK